MLLGFFDSFSFHQHRAQLKMITMIMLRNDYCSAIVDILLHSFDGRRPLTWNGAGNGLNGFFEQES